MNIGFSNVRLALVSNGYFLDYYVHDEIDNIRHMAIYKQPKIRQKLLENPTVDELSFVQDYLYNETEPDKNHLKKILRYMFKRRRQQRPTRSIIT